jgi:hypothetical protein
MWYEGKFVVNLTPHDITVYDRLGERVLVKFAKTGSVARLKKRDGKINYLGGIPLKKSNFGGTLDLPAKEEGFLFIVSNMVRNSFPEREDLLSPTDFVRDDQGEVIGCKAFDFN